MAAQGGRHQEKRRNLAAFWLLGLINNSAYVIMLAGANQISAAAVGLVYLAAVGPSLLCKASVPYWFHLVRYRTRMQAVALLMTASYTTVALSSSRGWQLLGVVLASLQSGLGEASCLALTSHYRGRAAITMWSSGTGFAGVFGYAWVLLLHFLAGLSFTATLLLANATCAAWLAVYHLLLEAPEERAAQLWRHDSADWAGAAAASEGSLGGRAAEQQRRRQDGGGSRGGAPQVPLLAEAAGRDAVGEPDSSRAQEGGSEEQQRLLGGDEGASSDPQQAQQAQQSQQQQQQQLELGEGSEEWRPSKAGRMTWRERLQRTVALWPYMVPLFLVYFAEYAMQSGTWTAIGFPVTSEMARHRFYFYANWKYQMGVFLSRSSGMLYQASRTMLWAMPIMQVGWLVFFLLDAVHHWWYNYGLLLPCFMTGLLGGAVYVNAFTLISKEVPPQYREFSLGAASLADSLGVALADVCGILIQGCLFKANGLEGADFAC
ncbi:Batten s disease Cln3 isoform A [Chlorella sorokiniana]|uniref:Batten s disease Cln3 isoform A n=1 Tax=Chlorella sorokiniana TaxID=3076 RepID=A0A2P6TPA4_CHLSO|nr:Batten s disease Cln3 isoform A [Chlorella sorokiniana]|eukprot:PRW51162.1 Batten s disease Cln3 isoform A [Chlorella sorokiniana]